MVSMKNSRVKKLVVRIVVLVLACLMFFGTLYSVIVYTIMNASAQSYIPENEAIVEEYIPQSR